VTESQDTEAPFRNTVCRTQARAEDNYCRLEQKTSYALEQLNAEAITLKEKVNLIPKE